MQFISKRKAKKINSLEKEFASEIVEIFEEKLEELNVTLPGIAECKEDKRKRIKSRVKNELIYEIETFICTNRKIFIA